MKGFLVFKSIISLIDGIALVVVPIAYMNLVELYLGDTGILMARFFGALLIGVGLICWFSRGGTRKTVGGTLLALFVADTLGFLIALKGQLAGLMNALGWVIVAIWLILALGLAYFRFLKT